MYDKVQSSLSRNRCCWQWLRHYRQGKSTSETGDTFFPQSLYLTESDPTRIPSHTKFPTTLPAPYSVTLLIAHFTQAHPHPPLVTPWQDPYTLPTSLAQQQKHHHEWKLLSSKRTRPEENLPVTDSFVRLIICRTATCILYYGTGREFENYVFNNEVYKHTHTYTNTHTLIQYSQLVQRTDIQRPRLKSW